MKVLKGAYPGRWTAGPGAWRWCWRRGGCAVWSACVRAKPHGISMSLFWLRQVDGWPGRAALVLAQVVTHCRFEGCLSWQVDGRPGRAALVLAARRLRAVEAQARVRGAVEREQADIAAMNERAYRKFARQCIRQRAETAKAVRELMLWKGAGYCSLCAFPVLPAPAGIMHPCRLIVAHGP